MSETMLKTKTVIAIVAFTNLMLMELCDKVMVKTLK